MASEHCSWCGEAIEPDDGFRAYEPVGDRRAAFCRLEHVVPWTMQGPHWEAGKLTEPTASAEYEPACQQCGAALGDVFVLLVHHRGVARIVDAFCSTDHMSDWAKAGGRWQ